MLSKIPPQPRYVGRAWCEQYGGPAATVPVRSGPPTWVPMPGQVSRDQIPGDAPHQRAINQQQPGTHAPFVSTPASRAASRSISRLTNLAA